MSIDSNINQGMKPWQKLLLLLTPFLLLGVYIALGHPWITQGMRKVIDPYMYTGYIRSYAVLVEDFGYTYYSNRLAHLIPSMLLVEWFGDWRGYQAYRLVLWTMAFWGSWMLARQFIGYYWSLAVATLFVFHPWFNTSVFWEHYDATAIVLLLWLLVCIVQAIQSLRITQQLPVAWLISGGLCYVLAGNANSYLIGVGGLYWAAAFVVVFMYRGFRKSVLFQLWGAIGFILGYIVLVLILNLILYPNPEGWYYDLFSIFVSLTFFDGGGAKWHTNIWTFMVQHKGYYTLLPVMVTGGAVYAFLGSLRRHRKLSEDLMIGWFTVVCLVLVAGLFLVMDLLFQAAVINLFFYFVYWLPSTLLGGLLLLRILCESMSTTKQASQLVLWRWFVCIVLGATLLIPVLLKQSSTGMWTVLYILIVGVLFAMFWALLGKQFSIRKQAVAVLIGLGLAASIPLFNLFAYRSYTKEQGQWTKELWFTVINFAQLLEKVLEPGDRYVFWYKENEVFNAINSYYLWGYSRLRDSQDSMSDLSHLLVEEKSRLRDVQQLIVLGNSAEEIRMGEGTLNREGFKWTLEQEGKVGENRVQCYYKILRLNQK